MPRFFKENLKEELYIDGTDAEHIIKSLRMKQGEKIVVSDTKGVDFECKILSVKNGTVNLEIIKESPNDTEPNVEITLFQCLPKGDKMDTIIRQGVEMGVCKIIPVVSERCISRPDLKALKKKQDRWQKIAFEAAQQSGRGKVPTVLETVSFSECCNMMKNFDSAVCFYELGGLRVDQAIKIDSKKIAVVIGPEGGFSVHEVEKIKSNGALLATLGKRILRSETAPVAAVAAIMFVTKNMC